MIRLSHRILAIALCGIFLGTMGYAQPPPADFSLRATVGGIAPWSQASTITIDALGHGTYTRYNTGGLDPVVAESTFTVSLSNVQQLWQSIQSSNFFSLPSPPVDSTIFGGSFAKVTVTANGASHQVLIKNAAHAQIQSLIDSLNAIDPPSLQLLYSPPTQLNIVPIDPCNSLFGATGSMSNRQPGTRSAADPKGKSRYTTSSINAEVVVPHAGVVVAYDVPLAQAVATKVATLKSKGQFFGDDVSISVDNRIPKPSNTINVTVYLEFWGPLATQANADRIAADIDIRWNGHTTSSGKTVDVSVVTRINPGASAPPGTPGYDEIQLVPKDAVRSYVSGSPGPNTGTGAGQWEVGMPLGTYAHEAGHLMGLPDRYVDYQKQPDGSWVTPGGGKSYPNDDQFATYVASKNPGSNQADIKTNLSKMDVASVPKDGSENDLMANVSKPVRQSDIDLIAANPGLLVIVPAGTVLVNKNGQDQNIIVTHSDDIFVKPGQRRTLNGLYGACIDHNRSIPDSLVLFDIIPSLGSWKGIPAAGYMYQLVHFVDSAGLYCDLNFSTQSAIWRISDNSLLLFDTDAQILLSLAGIHLEDQILNFPHMTTRSIDDSTTFSFVPDQLFVADIQPRFVDGSPGNKVTFNASVSQPVDAGFTTDFSWTANGPDTTALPISGIGTSGSLTPIRTGIYEVGLNVSVTDSALNKRTFKAPGKAYVIVPDSATETFEQGTLPDKFPWRTYGDVPWSISHTTTQTGNSSAQAGMLAPGQTSSLAIDLALPADGAITFSIRTATVEFIGQCQFSIDSAFVTEFSGMADWKIVTYPLKAGVHTLEWKSLASGTSAGKVWLDNIFFPAHSVVTSVNSVGGTIPVAYFLYQNYPNPFNPTTSIHYDLPHRSHVTVTVFNTLGQQVAQLVNGDIGAGHQSVQFDASGLASGVYFYRLQTVDFVQTRKLLLLK